MDYEIRNQRSEKDEKVDYMHTLFGVRIGNAMMRNGMYSIDDFIEHCQKYPHGIYSNQPYWYRIGRKSYDKIVAIIDRELTRFLQEKIIEDQIIPPCCPGCKHAANNICHKNQKIFCSDKRRSK